MTINWKAVEQYFTVVQFQFHPVCTFGKFISFGLGTVTSERVKKTGRFSCFLPLYYLCIFVVGVADVCRENVSRVFSGR